MPLKTTARTPYPVRVTRIQFAISALFCPVIAYAAPQGGTVTSGSASINQAGQVTTITQASHKAAIDWQGFSIGNGETVTFKQPDASAITLNRVIGNEKSVIEGALNANGRVFLINSNGLLFTKDSSVNTAGIVASTLNISNEDFNSGHYVFKGSGGQIINQGTLTATEGGYVALLGGSVSNQGTITATRGSAVLGSGKQITLNFSGDSLLSVSIDEGVLNALVENKQAIYADGGQVILTAQAADDLLSAQVNNSGLIQAHSINDLKGSIELYAHGGTTSVSGTLDASAPNQGDGGKIETSGTKVKIADSAHITTLALHGKTGTWTLDPDGFVVGAGGDMTATALSSALDQNNVAIASTQGSGSSGDIVVNDAVSWSANSTLTLNASNNIRINAPISATGTSAGLVMNYGGYATTGSTASDGDYLINTAKGANITLSGTHATLSINGNSYTLIHSMDDLAAISSNPDGTATGYYALAQDLDASGKTYTNFVVSTLTGTLAGMGHKISKLSITGVNDDSKYDQNVGLIASAGSFDTRTSVIRDIGLVDVNIQGYQNVGALTGQNFGSISNAYVSGSVSGNMHVGGLVGDNRGAISASSSSATLGISTTYDTSYSDIGGLVGRNFMGSITNSHATGSVTAISSQTQDSLSNIGGLAGRNTNGTISDCYATGNVTTSSQAYYVGGLVGTNGGARGIISYSYATGNVKGGAGDVGGLAGFNAYGAQITNSYATGNVSGVINTSGISGVGGLVGENLEGSITNSHATGNVSGSSAATGGLVGNNGGTISHSYATGDVTGTNNTVGGLAGYNAGSISDSSATGNVSGENAGGLTGGNTGSISNSTATGTVDSKEETGDKLTGTNTGTVTNSSYHDVKAEAAQQARVDSATRVTRSLLQSRQTDTDEEAGKVSLLNSALSIDNHIVVQAQRNYAASVKNIEVDGINFDLEDTNENTKHKKSGGN